MITLTGLRARPVLPPFRRPPVSASGAIPKAPLVLFDLETSAGITGRSYVFGFTAWALPAIASCARGLFDLVTGDPLAPVDLEAKLRRQLTLLDPNGLVGLALAGLDMAAWDALAQARGVPLVTLLGGALRAVPAYNSTGLWIQPVETLPDEAETLLAEGFGAIKLRLGRDDFAQDLAAVRAVKKRIGDRATLMCDFNQRLTRTRGCAGPAPSTARACTGSRSPCATTTTRATRASRPRWPPRSRPARTWWIPSRWPGRSRSGRSTS
jgi:mandelate racemase